MPMTRPKPRQDSQAPSGVNEAAGQRIGVFDIAVGAVQAVAVLPDLGVPALVVHDVHGQVAGAHAQRRVQRFHHALALGAGKAEAVLHHMQDAAGLGAGLAFSLPFFAGAAARRHGVFLGVHAGVALLLQEAADFFFGEVGWHRDREGHDQARIAGGGRAFGQRVEDRVGRVAPHQLPQPRQNRRARANSSFRWSFSSVIVPTVLRELRTGLVWSMAMAGRMPSMRFTCGLSMRSRNWRA